MFNNSATTIQVLTPDPDSKFPIDKPRQSLHDQKFSFGVPVEFHSEFDKTITNRILEESDIHEKETYS